MRNLFQLNLFEALHTIGYTYGNCLGLTNLMLDPDESTLILFNMERASRYTEAKTHKVLPIRKLSAFRGDLMFTSVNQMQMNSTILKDDLENLLYFLVYLRTQELPWYDFLIMNDVPVPQIFNKVRKSKQSVSLRELCASMPERFFDFALMIRRLSPADCPNYVKMRKILEEIILQEEIESNR